MKHYSREPHRKGIKVNTKKLKSLYKSLPETFTVGVATVWLDKFYGLRKVPHQTVRNYIREMIKLGWVKNTTSRPKKGIYKKTENRNDR